MNIDADVTRVEVIHVELVTEGPYKEGANRVQRRDLVGEQGSFRLIPILQKYKS